MELETQHQPSCVSLVNSSCFKCALVSSSRPCTIIRLCQLLSTHLTLPASSLGLTPPASAAAPAPCGTNKHRQAAHPVILVRHKALQEPAHKSGCDSTTGCPQPHRAAARLSSSIRAQESCNHTMHRTTAAHPQTTKHGINCTRHLTHATSLPLPGHGQHHSITQGCATNDSLLDACCELRRLRRLLLILPLLLRLGGPLGLLRLHLQGLEAQGGAHPAPRRGVGGV